MPYQIIEFDDVTLPQYNPNQDDSTADVPSALRDSIGGTFDYFGTATSTARKYQINLTGWYVGELSYMVDESGNQIVDESGNYLIAGTAANMLRAQVQALRAKTGVRGTLTRKRLDDSVEQWITARLLYVHHTADYEDAISTAELDCAFESAMTAWRAATQTVTSANAAAGGTATLSVPVSGDTRVDDATVTVTRTSGTITSIVLIASGIHWTWTGSIPTGALSVDCSGQTVRLNGVDAYSGFALGSAHTAGEWLPLDPGSTPISVTVIGGSATVTVSHYNQWR